ncbi:MAG: rhomboid family intramembrane serine protease [Thermoleophilia bacterium]|nr:rhomboid family intramembrane serine protease [Thermoleophilia bacterium]
MSEPVRDPEITEARCHWHPDRETLLSCSTCDRPICPDCARTAAVGMKCPDCAGGPAPGSPGALVRDLNVSQRTGGAPVTVAIIVLCLAIAVVELAQGVTVSGTNAGIAVDLGLFGPFVADGQWYRIITSAFVHAGLIHLIFNMIVLWWLGGALERYAGSLRFSTIYLASVVWGAAGALLFAPNALTVGASGGIYGLMAALLVLERQQGIALLGSSVGVFLLLNLGITFIIPGISIGGHLGGLLGGFLAALVLSGLGRGHMAYGRLAPAIIAGTVAVVGGGFALAVLVA